jgi:hypothetical protein
VALAIIDKENEMVAIFQLIFILFMFEAASYVAPVIEPPAEASE